jgi:hypothetical protein
MTSWHDDDEDEWDDADEPEAGPLGAAALSPAESPDPSDLDPPADDDDAVPCPFCGRAVYEFADVCPRCHNFIGGSDDPSRGPRRSWWVVAVIVLCLMATLVVCY